MTNCFSGEAEEIKRSPVRSNSGTNEPRYLPVVAALGAILRNGMILNFNVHVVKDVVAATGAITFLKGGEVSP